jgi:hypothetical protein
MLKAFTILQQEFAITANLNCSLQALLLVVDAPALAPVLYGRINTDHVFVISMDIPSTQ